MLLAPFLPQQQLLDNPCNPPTPQEPEFFSETCGYSPAACSAEAQQEYLLKTMKLQEWEAAAGRLAASEASTHYGRSGHVLAQPLAEVRCCCRCERSACWMPSWHIPLLP